MGKWYGIESNSYRPDGWKVYTFPSREAAEAWAEKWEADSTGYLRKCKEIYPSKRELIMDSPYIRGALLERISNAERATMADLLTSLESYMIKPTE